MYSKLPSFVFGFHGCDIKTKEAILCGSQSDLQPSKNIYDWLGSGIYFWEQNPQRALAWAEMTRDHPNKFSKYTVTEPAVIGAVIDLGNCMNLMDSIHIDRLKIAYDFLKDAAEVAHAEIPVNKGSSDDKPLRELDRAVIETLHFYISKHTDEFKPYDTVRGLFLEGGPIYPGAFFREETHIQICVRNKDCIKAYFEPREKRPVPFI